MSRKKIGKILNCQTCGKEMYVKKHRLETQKYCSIKCIKRTNTPWNKGLTKLDDERIMSVSRKATEQMHREYANGTRDRYVITKKANEVLRKKGIEKFLTNPTKHITKRGYMAIYVPGRGNVNEHCYVWEQAGRTVPKGYHLHHIDRNPLNNKLENLQLVSASEHRRLHFQARDENTGRFKKS